MRWSWSVALAGRWRRTSDPAFTGAGPGRSRRRCAFSPIAFTRLKESRVRPSPTLILIDLQHASKKGDANAPITVVEFADFECPFCKQYVPSVDQALKDIRQAKSDDDKKAAFQKIAQVMTSEVPAVPWAKIEEYIAWPSNIHGVIQTDRSGVVFDKAWIEK